MTTSKKEELKSYLKKAKQQRDKWIEAESAVMSGQSYTIGSRQLSRASLGQIKEQIKFWNGEISKTENALKGGRGRVYRVVPRDL